MDLMDAMSVSASGMFAQGHRMKVISENIANANSAVGENGEPYRRQVLHFKTAVDRATGLRKVEVADVNKDYKTPLKVEFNPAHPMADERGFVQMPNVNTMTESIDMREATRLYEANMQAIEASKDLMVRSLELLR